MHKKLKQNLIFVFFVFFSEFSFVFLIRAEDSLKWVMISGNSIYEWLGYLKLIWKPDPQNMSPF